MTVMTPAASWEIAVLGHVERIRYELALVDGALEPEYDALFEACTRAAALMARKLEAERPR